MSLIEHLAALVAEISFALPKVSKRRMFGCDAFFANDNIFALIWKIERIGVRLPNSGSYDELMALAGSVPWQAGNKVMSHWVLVPESFHDDTESLQDWITKAHGAAMTAPSKVAKATAKKKTTTKRNAR